LYKFLKKNPMSEVNETVVAEETATKTPQEFDLGKAIAANRTKKGVPPAEKTEEKPKSEPPAQKIETPKTATEEKPAETKIPTFEELMSEKTQGKFKNWEEVEAVLTKPEKKYHKQAELLNELLESGVTPDNEWFVIQNTDYDKIQDSEVLLKSKIKLDNPNLTPEELEYEYQQRYKIGEWEEDDDTPLSKAMKAKRERETAEAKEALKANKEKLSLTPKTDEKLVEQRRIESQKAKEKWEKAVDEVAKNDKISLKIGDMELDYVVPKENIKAASDTLKGVYSDISVFFDRFKTENGYDLNKIANLMYRADNLEKIVEIAVSQAKAKGSEEIVKEIKNTDFTPEIQLPNTVAKSRSEQIAQGFSKNVNG